MVIRASRPVNVIQSQSSGRNRAGHLIPKRTEDDNRLVTPGRNRPELPDFRTKLSIRCRHLRISLPCTSGIFLFCLEGIAAMVSFDPTLNLGYSYQSKLVLTHEISRTFFRAIASCACGDIGHAAGADILYLVDNLNSHGGRHARFHRRPRTPTTPPGDSGNART